MLKLIIKYYIIVLIGCDNMKLNKKGFTLVELLAVITIMSIIGVIAVISIDGMMDEANKTECEAVVSSLENATKEYISDKRFEITTKSYNVKIEDLIDNGYLTEKIANPFTKEKDVTSVMKSKVIKTTLNDDYTVNTITIDFIDCANGKFGN